MFLVVADQLGGLDGDLFKDVGDEGVHDAHGSLGDAHFGVHLLEHAVDVDGVGVSPLRVTAFLGQLLLYRGCRGGILFFCGWRCFLGYFVGCGFGSAHWMKEVLFIMFMDGNSGGRLP